MVFVFGDCFLDLDRRELGRAGRVQPLEGQAFTVLVHLVIHRDRAVAKDELLAACWPGSFVTEAALTRSVRLIRQAVGDDADRQVVIKTLRGYGYRFVAPVEPQSRLAEPLLPAAVIPPASGPQTAALPVSAAGLPCPQCQTPNRGSRQFCAACGQALWMPCPQCGFGNGPTERFCGGCGGDVAAPAPGPPRASTPAPLAPRLFSTPLPPPGERKQGTVLVGEIEGGQRLRQTADTETVDDLLHRGFALLVAEAHCVEGWISQVVGDSFTALFGAPVACEDHVLRALHAALGMRRAFTVYAAELQQTLEVGLTLRLGVHTGPLIVRALSPDRQFTYTAPGATLEVTTALQQLAPAGTIAVSTAVHEAATGFFRFTALGEYTLPERFAAEPVYTCDGVGPVTSRLAGALARGRTGFQGRTRELAVLADCWARVCQGAGQVVCLMGEAGIGKSRLAYECQQTLGAVRCLTVQALSYGQAMPYHALIPLLRTLLGVQEAESSAQQHQAVCARLDAIDSSLVADVPLLALVLGVSLEPEQLPVLTPGVQRRRLQHACLQVLLQQAVDTPLCLLVEDGHWLDPSSQELLDLLVTATARRPILMLCTARPGFRHAWADYTYFHQVAVEPLGAAETKGLLHDLLLPYGAAPTLHAWIHTRTGGNPLFVEELVRTMQAHGLLVLQGDVYEVAEATRVTLPTSIQGIVKARLDQLPTAEKRLLQVAAVIAPEVPWPVLHTLMGQTEDVLQHGLQRVQAAELLYEMHVVPYPLYTFKHALVQEEAYQSLLLNTRQQLHQQVAQVLEAQFPDIVETKPEFLAHHYTEAGVPEQAIPYWQQAGQRAIARSANQEAIRHLTKGLDVLAALPETPERTQHELTLSITLAAPLLMVKGYAAPEVARVYNRVQQACRHLGDTPQVFPALYGLSLFYLARGECHTARQFGQQALHLARQVQVPDYLLLAHTMLGVVLFHCGAFTTALAHLEQGWSRYDPMQHHALALRYGDDPGGFCLAYITMLLWLLGYPDQAAERSTAAVALARQLGHPFSLGMPLAIAAVLSQFCREGAATQEGAETLSALATEQGFAHWLAQGMILRGWGLACKGHLHEGIEQLRQGLAAWGATGAWLIQPYWLALLAETYWWAGQPEAGLHTVAAALEAAEHNREPWWDAHLYWLKGELLLAQYGTQHTLQDVEACFRHALAIARRQQAKSLELRAAISLARLWQRQGKRAEAYQLLAGVYGWFTEGFDTADLQEARALLETLAG